MFFCRHLYRYQGCFFFAIFSSEGSEPTKGENSAVELLEEMGFQCGREVGPCLGKGCRVLKGVQGQGVTGECPKDSGREDWGNHRED